MQNPFEVIDSRLNNLENLLIDLKHVTLPKLLALKTNEPEPSEFLTKKEAATLLSCSPSTIDNYRRSGILKRHYIGSSVRFKRAELLSIVEHKKVNND